MNVTFFSHRFSVKKSYNTVDTDCVMKVLHDEISFTDAKVDTSAMSHSVSSYMSNTQKMKEREAKKMLRKRSDYLHSSAKHSFHHWLAYRAAFGTSWDTVAEKLKDSNSGGLVFTNQPVCWNENTGKFDMVENIPLGITSLPCLPSDLLRWSDVWPSDYALGYLLSCFRHYDNEHPHNGIPLIEKRAVCNLQCGTGFLGILALKLGAEMCMMTDDSASATTLTRTNLGLNGLLKRKDEGGVLSPNNLKMRNRALRRQLSSENELAGLEREAMNVLALSLSVTNGKHLSLPLVSAETKKRLNHKGEIRRKSPASKTPNYMTPTESKMLREKAKREKKRKPRINVDAYRMNLVDFDSDKPIVSSAVLPATPTPTRQTSKAFGFGGLTTPTGPSRSALPENIERGRGIFPKALKVDPKLDRTIIIENMDWSDVSKWPQNVFDLVIGGDIFAGQYDSLTKIDISPIAMLLNRILKPSGVALFALPSSFSKVVLADMKLDLEIQDLYLTVHDPVELSAKQTSYLSTDGIGDIKIVFLEIGPAYNPPESGIRALVMQLLSKGIGMV